MKLNDIFIFHNAKSKGFQDYEAGDVPFVTNGFKNNGIIGLVLPKNGDRIFNFEGICLSAFCEATVHKPRFLPRGNGGSGLLILEPKEKMDFYKLLLIAAYISKTHMWRFSYGRMMNRERAENLKIEINENLKPSKKIEEIKPNLKLKEKLNILSEFKIFKITDLFNLERGHFHALDRLEKGEIPTISRIADDNGVVGFFEKPKNAKVYCKRTITVSTTSGDAFLQLDDFIATDNVVILIPKLELSIEELLFITIMINKEKWRVSYGRQCYKTIFAKTKIYMPVDSYGNINKDYIINIINSSYNIEMISSYIKN